MWVAATGRTRWVRGSLRRRGGGGGGGWTLASTVPFSTRVTFWGACHRGLFPLPFFGHFEGGFAGASKPESFLWAIRSLASELSKVEVLSPLLSSGRWSSACLLSGCWSSEGAFVTSLNAVRCDTICWQVSNVSRLLFIKYRRKASFERRLVPLGDGAANLCHDISGLRRWGVATSFLATLPTLLNGWQRLTVLPIDPFTQLTNSCLIRCWLLIDYVLILIPIAAHAQGIGHTLPLTIIYQLNVI